MILEALAQTAQDLLTGLLILVVLCINTTVAYCAMRVAGKRNTERQQREFDRAIGRELATLETDLPEYLRVTGGACSGPDLAETRERR